MTVPRARVSHSYAAAVVLDIDAPHPDAALGPDSASWQLRHPLRFVGVARAGLLQLARPEIAAAVAGTGSFEADPLGRISRTLGVVAVVKFGSPPAAEAAIERLREAHAGVPGADAPRLRWWVLATAIDSTLALDRRYVGIADDALRRRFYQESRSVAFRMGIPDVLSPPDLEAFQVWFSAQLATLVVGDDARRLGNLLLDLPGVGPAPRAVLRNVTADLLPPAVRDGYGLRASSVMPVIATVSKAAMRPLRPLRGRVPGHPGRLIERRALARLS